MKIAVVGAGHVGKALGGAWTRKGHEVVYGVRNPKDAKYASLGAGSLRSIQEVASGADVLVLSTPWTATEDACRSLGDLKGRIVIDCTNPLAMGPDGLDLAAGLKGSGGEMVQSWLPGAHVYKALNQAGVEVMGNASRLPLKPVMFVAGDDQSHKPSVLALVNDLAFEAVDSGPLRSARLLESLAMLWINLVMKQGLPRDFAFCLTHPNS